NRAFVERPRPILTGSSPSTMRSPGVVLPCSIKHATSTHMEGARAMIQVTERARETFKNKLELIERPDVMLRLGRTDSGLGVFPDTLAGNRNFVARSAICWRIAVVRGSEKTIIPAAPVLMATSNLLVT